MLPIPPFRSKRWQSLQGFIYKYGMFIVIIAMFSILSYNQYLILEKNYDSKGMKAYNYDFNSEFKAEGFTGISYSDCGFFVDTKGRNFQSINKTKYHEACHQLIGKDRGHFCD